MWIARFNMQFIISCALLKLNFSTFKSGNYGAIRHFHFVECLLILDIQDTNDHKTNMKVTFLHLQSVRLAIPAKVVMGTLGISPFILTLSSSVGARMERGEEQSARREGYGHLEKRNTLFFFLVSLCSECGIGDCCKPFGLCMKDEQNQQLSII